MTSPVQVNLSHKGEAVCIVTTKIPWLGDGEVRLFSCWCGYRSVGTIDSHDVPGCHGRCDMAVVKAQVFVCKRENFGRQRNFFNHPSSADSFHNPSHSFPAAPLPVLPQRIICQIFTNSYVFASTTDLLLLRTVDHAQNSCPAIKAALQERLVRYRQCGLSVHPSGQFRVTQLTDALRFNLMPRLKFLCYLSNMADIEAVAHKCIQFGISAAFDDSFDYDDMDAAFEDDMDAAFEGNTACCTLRLNDCRNAFRVLKHAGAKFASVSRMEWIRWHLRHQEGRRFAEDAWRSAEDARRRKEDARRKEEDARRRREDARRRKEDLRRDKEIFWYEKVLARLTPQHAQAENAEAVPGVSDQEVNGELFEAARLEPAAVHSSSSTQRADAGTTGSDFSYIKPEEVHELSADVAQAILQSKMEIPSLPLNRDGCCLFRLTRMADAPHVEAVLINAPSLSHCHKLLAEAGCEFRPVWGCGARFLVPFTEQQLDDLREVGRELKSHHVFALREDRKAIEIALKGIPKKIRPKLSDKHKAMAEAEIGSEIDSTENCGNLKEDPFLDEELPVQSTASDFFYPVYT